MTGTTIPAEVPQDRQLADAQAAADKALTRWREANEAMHAARGAYTLARSVDPAGQDTDQARHAWCEALHDLADAQADMERARDELTAVHRQSATYAVTEEGR